MRAVPLLVLLASCATAPTGPDPALKTTAYDCDTPGLEAERPRVAPAVEDCVAGPSDDVATCLDDLAKLASPADTVGCEARDRGARASSIVASGTADERERRITENVRTWVRSGGRSFR